MEVIQQLIDFILHFDEYLAQVIAQYGAWTMAFLFLIIFMETGLVVTPFLPGDSLLFAAGAFAARGALNIWALFILLSIAAVLGDTVNYWIGHKVGAKAYRGEVRWIKKDYMVRTHEFFEKHGGKTIFLARFVPIVRTFAPFVAGSSQMSYSFFLRWNVIGGITWVAIFLFLGYFFGNIPFVQEHFEWVIVAIVLISVLPAVFEGVRARRETRNKPAAEETTV
ncbi:MAG: DedA family protein [Anaerolineae bacterium]|nr:DedA family protein [Anaerolineae bacterium]